MLHWLLAGGLADGEEFLNKMRSKRTFCIPVRRVEPPNGEKGSVGDSVVRIRRKVRIIHGTAPTLEESIGATARLNIYTVQPSFVWRTRSQFGPQHATSIANHQWSWLSLVIVVVHQQSFLTQKDCQSQFSQNSN